MPRFLYIQTLYRNIIFIIIRSQRDGDGGGGAVSGDEGAVGGDVDDALPPKDDKNEDGTAE